MVPSVVTHSLAKFIVLRPVLTRLSDGTSFTRFFQLVFRILSVLTAIGVLAMSYDLWAFVVEDTSRSIGTVLGVFLAQLLLLALGFVVANVLLIRADDIGTLPSHTDYPIGHIGAIALKAIGEVVAACYIAAGLGIALLRLFGGAALARDILGGFPLLTTNDGVVALALAIVLAFAFMSLFYYLSERVFLLIAIERNTRKS